MTSEDSPQPSRFVVGLDLGTTNSAMAYVDTFETPRRIQTFAIPQIVAPGQIESRETLPSFHYQPANSEFPDDAVAMNWREGNEKQRDVERDESSSSSASHASSRAFVGQFARDHGTLVPGRMIASAKSWLCHNGVDRTADLLPWQGADDVERLSPVAVSAAYLKHAREAWDAQWPEHPLAEQDFVLTLPASFDEVARELTVKAAKQSGLNRIVLIEEPQAAFYAWIDKHSQTWSVLVSPGQKILVCDVGGGTSDFTLIRVRKGNDGAVQFHRVAVGDHLILGGDNFDLALAHNIERRLKGDGHLEPRQWSVLVRSCRQLKEVLMADDAPDKWTLTLPGGGSKLIGGSLQVPVTRDEVRDLLVKGFFPDVQLDAKPQSSQSGFQEFGLPYVADPSVTTHLAAFLSAHRYVAMDEQDDAGARGEQQALQDSTVKGSKGFSSGKSSLRNDPARPDIVLFNGGVFASPVLRRRIIESLEGWFRNEVDPQWTPVVLENERLDLAVARGAAYYGMVRRGEGVRIAAGLARTYYIGVESAQCPIADTDVDKLDGMSSPQESVSPKTEAPSPGPRFSALCLLPAGIEPGHEIDLTSRQFELLVAQPIEFPLYVSSIRLTDKPGDLVPVDPEQIRALPPIRTVLKQGKSKEAGSIPVILQAKLTEIGTLDLWCRDLEGKRSWKLLFDVRSASQTDVAAHESAAEQQGVFDDESVRAACEVIASTFGPEKPDPDQLMKRLVEKLGMDRNEWPSSLMRRLWDALIESEAGRQRSALHEARWLNLCGFVLRPGYGLAVDDWRVSTTWKLLSSKLQFNTPQSRAELSVLWRRVAGGLTAGQQKALVSPLASIIKQSLRASTGGGKGNDFGRNPHESAETVRLLGACEHLPAAMKVELGDLLLDMLPRDRFASLRSAIFWATARLGARRLVYGPLNTVVPAEVASRWLDKVMKNDGGDSLAVLVVMQLARKTGDRYRDIDDSTRAAVLKWMDRISAPRTFKQLVREVGNLETETQSMIFGESLPRGLKIL